MQQSQKQIVWGIAGLVGLYIGYGFFHSWFIKPLNDLDSQIETANVALDRARRDERQLRMAQAALVDARRMSLPKNRSEARRLYLRWIEELANECGIQLSQNPESLNERIEGGTYVTFPVKVDGIATYEQALLFLKRFSEVNLLQRLSQFDLFITTAGDPRLNIRFTAEGLALLDAPDRSTLFTETLLADDLAPTQTLLTVADAKGFPEKPPFRVKLGQEFVDVTAINKNQWTIERGVGETKPAQYSKGQVVANYPLRSTSPTERPVEALYKQLVADNPFRKPRPPIEYRPRISPSGSQLVTRGTPLSITIKAESWDPEAGTPRFVAEGELPPGMTLDEKTGALKWAPEKDVQAGEYKAKIAAIGSYNDSIRTSADLTFRLREANQPPTFRDARPTPAFLGRPWTLNLAATDPDPGDKLKYALTGQPPMGATVDQNGLVSWTPPEDLPAGEVSLTVTATDSGDPPMTATRSVNVRVEEDAARFTRFVGLVTEDGEQEAWFFDPSINKNTKLKVGSLFKFADVEGTVEEIHPVGDYVILNTGGKKMRINSGSTLREMTAVAEPASPAPVATPGPEPKAPTEGS